MSLFSSLVGFQRLYREHSLRESVEDMLTVATEIMLSLLSPSIQIIACLHPSQDHHFSSSSVLIALLDPKDLIRFCSSKLSMTGSLTLCGLAISPCLRYVPGLHIHSPPQALNGVERGRYAGYPNMYCRNKVGRCPTH